MQLIVSITSVYKKNLDSTFAIHKKYTYINNVPKSVITGLYFCNFESETITKK